MPFRHAHWWMLGLLAPMVAVAFWRDYFAVLPTASFAFHAHGITATAWLALIGLQSWSAHARRWPLHRASGRAVFVLVPLFVVGGVLAISSMAGKFAEGTHPFYAVMGGRLGLLDMVMTLALVALVAWSLRRRRQVATHAAAMLATALLVLPPVLARLPLPRIPHLGDVVVIAVAILLAWRQPRGRGVFVAMAALQVVLALLMDFVGPTDTWSRWFRGLAGVDPWPATVVAAMLAEVVLVLAWRAGHSPARAVVKPAARPAVAVRDPG